MNINKSYNKINFNGYKNVMTEHMSSLGCKITYISAQLDNNGTPDLSEYRKLQRIEPLYKSNTRDDVFTLLHVVINKDKYLFLNNNSVPDDNDLLLIQENFTKENYSKTEAAILKLYTLFSRITKTMENHDVYKQGIIKDENFIKIVENTIKSLQNIFNNYSKAMTLVHSGIMNNHTTLKQNAQRINHNMAQNMIKFFI